LDVARSAVTSRKKVWEPMNFMKKWIKKKSQQTFLSQFKSQMAFTNLEKTDMVLIHRKARGQ
jgi:hypothetical protein